MAVHGPMGVVGSVLFSLNSATIFSATSSFFCVACLALWYSWAKVVQGLDEDCAQSNRTFLLEDPNSSKRIPAPSIHSDASKSLTVVFPAYNESGRVEPAIEEAIEFLNNKRKRSHDSFSYEIIVVDDGSIDDTYEFGMKFVGRLGLDNFRVIRLPVNKGKGAAVRSGVLISRGELILFADSDGATQFSDFDRLHSRMKEIASDPSPKVTKQLFSSIADKHGFVAGSRAHLESTEAVTKREWYRNMMMHGFHFLVTLVAGNRMRDTQCGFKVCL
jgi:dolichyl-phosphate beta-glucosyltransferase